MPGSSDLVVGHRSGPTTWKEHLVTNQLSWQPQSTGFEGANIVYASERRTGYSTDTGERKNPNR